MKPEQQRIATAEVCGWTHNSTELPLGQGVKWANPQGRINHQCLFPKFPCEVPDYLSDLNAMHEVEKGLTEEQQEEFVYQLKEICCPITGEDWAAIHATAAQRAEAFLRTLNLWVISPSADASASQPSTSP